MVIRRLGEITTSGTSRPVKWGERGGDGHKILRCSQSVGQEKRRKFHPHLPHIFLRIRDRQKCDVSLLDGTKQLYCIFFVEDWSGKCDFWRLQSELFFLVECYLAGCIDHKGADDPFCKSCISGRVVCFMAEQMLNPGSPSDDYDLTSRNLPAQHNGGDQPQSTPQL